MRHARASKSRYRLEWFENLLSAGIHCGERRTGVVVTVFERSVKQLHWRTRFVWSNSQYDSLAVFPALFFHECQVAVSPDNGTGSQRQLHQFARLAIKRRVEEKYSVAHRRPLCGDLLRLLLPHKPE